MTRATRAGLLGKFLEVGLGFKYEFCGLLEEGLLSSRSN